MMWLKGAAETRSGSILTVAVGPLALAVLSF
jgi:hypothetical protein